VTSKNKNSLKTKQENLVKDYFDKYNKEWIENYKKEENVATYSFNLRKKLLIEMLHKGEGKVLDIGCGPAILTKELLEKGYEVWGIDVSQKMIGLAEQNITDSHLNFKAHFLVGDIYSLDFPDNFFDVVICAGVFSYLIDPEASCREIVRVLKDKGIALITVPTKRVTFDLLKIILAKLCFLFPHRQQFIRKLNIRNFQYIRYRPWMIKKLIESNSLKVLDYASFHFIFFPIDYLFPRLSLFIARKLDTKFMKSKMLGWLGKGYLVKVKKEK